MARPNTSRRFGLFLCLLALALVTKIIDESNR